MWLGRYQGLSELRCGGAGSMPSEGGHEHWVVEQDTDTFKRCLPPWLRLHSSRIIWKRRSMLMPTRSNIILAFLPATDDGSGCRRNENFHGFVPLCKGSGQQEHQTKDGAKGHRRLQKNAHAGLDSGTTVALANYLRSAACPRDHDCCELVI